MPRFEITEVALVHCNIVNNDISTIQESHIHLLQINHLVNYLVFHLKNLVFLKTFNSEFSHIVY